MARKQKYNYKSKEFLDQIESLAKKGLTDKEIAFSMGPVSYTHLPIYKETQ